MVQDTCFCCNGKLRQDKTDFIVNMGNEIVIIKNVPALICDICGERYFSAEISRRIDKVMESYHTGKVKSHTVPAREVELPA
jgi:YgiT-type zinc finger domain-containing protein